MLVSTDPRDPHRDVGLALLVMAAWSLRVRGGEVHGEYNGKGWDAAW